MTMNVSDDDRAPERILGSLCERADLSAASQGATGPRARDLRRDEDREGASPVVILSRRGSVERSIRRAILPFSAVRIRINAQACDRVGVMPEGMEFPIEQRSMAAACDDSRGHEPAARCANSPERSAGSPMASVRPQRLQELNAMTAALARDFPQTNGGHACGARAIPSGDRRAVVHHPRCADVGRRAAVARGLCQRRQSAARALASTCARESAIRSSLGATRWRVVRQLLVESVMLSLAAGMLALLISFAGIQILLVIRRRNRQAGWMDFSMDAGGIPLPRVSLCRRGHPLWRGSGAATFPVGRGNEMLRAVVRQNGHGR